MDFSVVKFGDPFEFAKLAIPFLMNEEPINQIQLGMLNNLGGLLAPFQWMFFLYDGKELAGVATKNRGPQFKLIVSPMDKKKVDFLVQEIATTKECNFSGVLAERATAEKFAKTWCQLKGLENQIEMAMGVFECSRVIIPEKVNGFYRLAKGNDLQKILLWRRDYLRETELPEETEEEANLATKKIIDTQTLKVWEFQGEIVSMANASPGTPRGGRISLVYTPPEKRGQNFASSLVATATQEFFDTGKKFGFLNTDLGNPVSNKIYERIGYRKVSESLVLKFF